MRRCSRNPGRSQAYSIISENKAPPEGGASSSAIAGGLGAAREEVPGQRAPGSIPATPEPDLMSTSLVSRGRCADHQRHDRHDDRIPQAGIDIAGRRHDRGGQQRQHAAEPAVADVIGQRHRGVADLVGNSSTRKAAIGP